MVFSRKAWMVNLMAANTVHDDLNAWLRKQYNGADLESSGVLDVAKGALQPIYHAPHVDVDMDGLSPLEVLEALKRARARQPPCPWDEQTCAIAARGGHLEVLQWARSQQPPCPWDMQTCVAAAECDHLELLQWARDNGCPLSCRPVMEEWEWSTTRLKNFLCTHHKSCGDRREVFCSFAAEQPAGFQFSSHMLHICRRGSEIDDCAFRGLFES